MSGAQSTLSATVDEYLAQFDLERISYVGERTAHALIQEKAGEVSPLIRVFYQLMTDRPLSRDDRRHLDNAGITIITFGKGTPTDTSTDEARTTVIEEARRMLRRRHAQAASNAGTKPPAVDEALAREVGALAAGTPDLTPKARRGMLRTLAQNHRLGC